MTPDAPKLIEELADRIHSKILSGDYPPGTRLKQELLAQEFDVSRTPIREALSRLEAKGIVSQAQRRSAVVKSPSSRDISEMYQVRAELEGLAAQLSARWITDPQLEELRSAHDAFAEAVRSLRAARTSDVHAATANPSVSASFEEASRQWLEMNARFHRTICESSNNRFLVRTLQDVTSGYARSVMLSSATGMNSYRIETTIAQHERILRALEEREPGKARRAMIEHILGASEFVIASFANLEPQS
ncbi:MAG TPA: GntR family transcriptional regulator [Stellaceae bacterium]|nr:GntR family transcriptional regulator [Stellaceae bacterium]